MEKEEMLAINAAATRLYTAVVMQALQDINPEEAMAIHEKYVTDKRRLTNKDKNSGFYFFMKNYTMPTDRVGLVYHEISKRILNKDRSLNVKAFEELKERIRKARKYVDGSLKIQREDD